MSRCGGCVRPRGAVGLIAHRSPLFTLKSENGVNCVMATEKFFDPTNPHSTEDGTVYFRDGGSLSSYGAVPQPPQARSNKIEVEHGGAEAKPAVAESAPAVAEAGRGDTTEAQQEVVLEAIEDFAELASRYPERAARWVAVLRDVVSAGALAKRTHARHKRRFSLLSKLNLEDSISFDKTVSEAVHALREDYKRHAARQNLISSPEKIRSKPRWHGVHKEGMKASEFLHLHFADELANGLRVSDIREFDERLFYSLQNESRRLGKDVSDLGFEKTTKVLNDRRASLAAVLGTTPGDAAFADFFSSMHTRLEQASRSRD